MIVRVRKSRETHLFDAHGVRLEGRAGDGPRMTNIVLRLSLMMQCHKLHCQMPEPQRTSVFDSV